MRSALKDREKPRDAELITSPQSCKQRCGARCDLDMWLRWGTSSKDHWTDEPSGIPFQHFPEWTGVQPGEEPVDLKSLGD